MRSSAAIAPSITFWSMSNRHYREGVGVTRALSSRWKKLSKNAKSRFVRKIAMDNPHRAIHGLVLTCIVVKYQGLKLRVHLYDNQTLLVPTLVVVFCGGKVLLCLAADRKLRVRRFDEH